MNRFFIFLIDMVIFIALLVVYAVAVRFGYIGDLHHDKTQPAFEECIKQAIVSGASRADCIKEWNVEDPNAPKTL